MIPPATMIPPPSSKNSEPKFVGGAFIVDSPSNKYTTRSTTTTTTRSAKYAPAKNEECHPTVIEINTTFLTRKILAPVPEEFLCPISFTVMEDPLMIRSGLNFERSAILGWLRKKNKWVCPITGEPLLPSMLVPNVPLRIRIRQWKNAPELTKVLEEDGEEDKQADHHQVEETVQPWQTGLMEEEDDHLSFETNDSWCWDGDVALCSDSEDDDEEDEKAPGGVSSRGKSPLATEEGAGFFVINGGENATRMTTESSKLEISDMPPQQVMRAVTRSVLTAARSA
jgi:hypothetical protein